MRIELITIGDELLLGFTIDTNAAYLARELAGIGIEIVQRTTVGDHAGEIAAVVREALDRTGAVITTGGLGPTSDDLTRPAIAELFGRKLRFDESIWERIEARWRARGLHGSPPATNRQQALVPDGATVLTNHHGTAPGIWLEDSQRRWVAMLPGVPREMRGMLSDALIPRVRERAGAMAGVVRSRTLRTTGIAESAVAERLGDLASGTNGLSLAYLPGENGVDLRLTAHQLPSAEADRALKSATDALRAKVGEYAYGENDEDLAAVVLEMCRARRLRIAVGESCTGGMLGERLTRIPGSSDAFVGGVIAYDNSLKVNLLGVEPQSIADHGAVSESVARQMARGARERAGADIGISITGIAGPGGGTADKPVGTVWIALSGPHREGATVEQARRSGMVGDREEIRYRATQAALEMLRRALTAP